MPAEVQILVTRPDVVAIEGQVADHRIGHSRGGGRRRRRGQDLVGWCVSATPGRAGREVTRRAALEPREPRDDDQQDDGSGEQWRHGRGLLDEFDRERMPRVGGRDAELAFGVGRAVPDVPPEHAVAVEADRQLVRETTTVASGSIMPRCLASARMVARARESRSVSRDSAA